MEWVFFLSGELNSFMFSLSIVWFHPKWMEIVISGSSFTKARRSEQFVSFFRRIIDSFFDDKIGTGLEKFTLKGLLNSFYSSEISSRSKQKTHLKNILFSTFSWLVHTRPSTAYLERIQCRSRDINDFHILSRQVHSTQISRTRSKSRMIRDLKLSSITWKNYGIVSDHFRWRRRRLSYSQDVLNMSPTSTTTTRSYARQR